VHGAFEVAKHMTKKMDLLLKISVYIKVGKMWAAGLGPA